MYLSSKIVVLYNVYLKKNVATYFVKITFLKNYN